MNHARHQQRRRTLLLTTLLCSLSSLAFAITTRVFTIDDAASFSAGELHGTAALSSGALIPGVGTRRIAIEGSPLAMSLLRLPNGDALIGTGNDGKIVKLHGDAVAPFAETGELLVSALALGPDGTVYAGTLPNGKVFSIGANGEARVLAQLADTQHVWALRYDTTRKVLFAATGPNGKLFAIDARGTADVFYDSENASHVMDVALDGQGGVYAALSDDAQLLHISAPGRAEVVYDFAGSELTSIALIGGDIAVAVNTFPQANKPATTTPPSGSSQASAPSTAPPAPPAGQRRANGKGQLWRVSTTGQARKLLDISEGHITDVQWADPETVLAAVGHDGRVLRVQRDGTHAVWIDVDERQVLAIDLTERDPLFITGDTGAVYRVLDRGSHDRMWTSKVLDAEFRARWGELRWRGEGSVQAQTRSGNTEKPDATWSDWSAPLSAPGPIRSPAARFVQVRLKLSEAAGTIVHAVSAHYLPDNQGALVRDIKTEPSRSRKPTTAAGASASSGSDASSSSGQHKLSWESDNPDGDALRYRLSFRAESQTIWRPILQETEVLTAKEYRWDTESIPDGYYRVRIEVSDEESNPAANVQRSSTESEPFLVDNHAPQVVGLKLSGGRIEGRALDSMGPINKLEYAVDGQRWMLFFPSDDLLDTGNEAFALTVPDLAPGSHIIAVRATDAAGNVGSAELSTR